MSQQAPAFSQSPFPPEVYSYAGLYNLGQPVTVYRVAYRQSIILGILCLFLAALFGGVALSGGSSGATNALMLFLSLLCVAGAAYYLVGHPVLHGSWRLCVCADGFLFIKGGQATPCRWDQIAFVRQRVVRHYTNGVYTGTTFTYTVQRADGVKIVFNQMFRDARQLGERIQREVTNRLTPQALAAVRAGQTLPFGRFSLNWQGLTTPKEAIPWSDIQQVTARSGLITIQRHNQRRGKSYGRVDSIPNLFVFLAVSEALVKGQAR
jgi:hypothetical protein